MDTMDASGQPDNLPQAPLKRARHGSKGQRLSKAERLQRKAERLRAADAIQQQRTLDGNFGATGSTMEGWDDLTIQPSEQAIDSLQHALNSADKSHFNVADKMVCQDPALLPEFLKILLAQGRIRQVCNMHSRCTSQMLTLNCFRRFTTQTDLVALKKACLPW